MGIKIGEAEQYLIALKHCEMCEANDANTCKTCEYHQKGSSAKCYDAIDIAIETMRKYQKIEQIIANNDNDGIIGRQVRELARNGNT